MSKIQATVVADSICNGYRITTMEVVMPRHILAEVKTHRVMKRTDGGMEVYDIPGIGFNDDEMLSRNSASSRAIPLSKMVEAIKNDPFIPIAWQRDHRGMQGTEYFTDPNDIQTLVNNHLSLRDQAIWIAELQNKLGVTKQVCNRYLEPYMWCTVLVTATEYENFFHLRCPQYHVAGSTNKVYRSWKDVSKDYPVLADVPELERLKSYNKGQAEIHMMALAEAMWDARNESKPKELKPGEWHIPFGDQIDEKAIVNILQEDGVRGNYWGAREELDLKIKIATARCARTSYTVVGEEGKSADYKKDIELHDKLLASGHMSPFEHCAQAMTEKEFNNFLKGYSDVDTTEDAETGWCHNLRGWKSYRSMIPNENRR